MTGFPRPWFQYLWYADMQAVAAGGLGSFVCELSVDWLYPNQPLAFLGASGLPDGIATSVRSPAAQTYAVLQTATLDCFNLSPIPIMLSQVRFMAVQA
jgi:hypothetical protein